MFYRIWPKGDLTEEVRELIPGEEALKMFFLDWSVKITFQKDPYIRHYPTSAVPCGEAGT